MIVYTTVSEDDVVDGMRDSDEFAFSLIYAIAQDLDDKYIIDAFENEQVQDRAKVIDYLKEVVKGLEGQQFPAGE